MSDVALVQLDDKETQELFKRLQFDKILKKDVKSVSRRALNPVKKAIQNAFLERVTSDPRMARLAVKEVIYKKHIGGNVNIYKPKGSAVVVAGGYNPPKGGKSGIVRNRKISAKTLRTMNYGGRSRYFILNMLNKGFRWKTRDGGVEAKRFFDVYETQMAQATKALSEGISQKIQELINSN